MKKSQILWQTLLATSAIIIPNDDQPVNDSFLNHVTFTGRFGLNINAKFGPRITAGGSAYNYLDGYVLPDSTGGLDPTGTYPSITYYWGYDNSARQVNDSVYNAASYNAALPNHSLLFTRSAGGDLGTRTFDDDPRLGLELSYDRELGRHNEWHYGIEAAVNYMNLCLHSAGTATGRGQQVAYSYVFNGRGFNAPPLIHAGGYNFVLGDSFEIGNVPNAISGTVPVSISESDDFKADIWGFRLGPYLQHPLGKRGEINFIGGLAAVLVDASGSWTQQITINGVTDPAHSGSGSNLDVLWGYYVGVNASYHLSKRWDVNAGVQYQDVGKYQSNIGSRQAELDMSGSVYITVGVSYKF